MVAPGRFRLEMDGEWDIDDLGSLAHLLRISYAYFYWLSLPVDTMDHRVRSRFAQYFWSGENVGDRFANELYFRIPDKDRLRVAAIHYSSPGWMEIAGVVSVISALAFCARAWLTNIEKAVEVYVKVENFFHERKLKRIEKKFDTAKFTSQTINEADELARELGHLLGFNDKQINKIIDLTGNPIAALRLMTTIAKENHRAMELEGEGKLKLPRS